MAVAAATNDTVHKSVTSSCFLSVQPTARGSTGLLIIRLHFYYLLARGSILFAFPEENLCGSVRRVQACVLDGRGHLARCLILDVVCHNEMGHHALELVRSEEPSWAEW